MQQPPAPPGAEAAKEKPAGEVTGLLSVIPEFFYDLLARVLPGALLLIGLRYAVGEKFPVTESMSPWIVLALSYGAGFLLNIGGVFWVALIGLLIHYDVPWACQYTGVSEMKALGIRRLNAIWQESGRRRDALAALDARAGGLLVKVLAEADAMNGIATALVVICVTMRFNSPNRISCLAGWQFAIGLALLAMLLMLLCTYRQVFYLERIDVLRGIHQSSVASGSVVQTDVPPNRGAHASSVESPP